MQIGETYAPHVVSVQEGDVRTYDGRIVCFRDLVKRRWGWPKKAAIAATDFMVLLSRETGLKPVLWVADPYRTQQQQMLFGNIPGLLDMLCAGLAIGSSKEAVDCDAPVRVLQVNFDVNVDDDGLVRDVTAVIAKRLGCSTQALRDVTKYNTTSTFVTLEVPASKFGHEGDSDSTSCALCMGKSGSHYDGCKGAKR